jgi:hypothetical protein
MQSRRAPHTVAQYPKPAANPSALQIKHHDDRNFSFFASCDQTRSYITKSMEGPQSSIVRSPVTCLAVESPLSFELPLHPSRPEITAWYAINEGTR